MLLSFLCVFPLPCLAISGRNASPRILGRFIDSEHREYTPRNPAGIDTYHVVHARAPCVPCSQKCETSPTAGRKIVAHVQKPSIYCMTYVAPVLFFPHRHAFYSFSREHGLYFGEMRYCKNVFTTCAYTPCLKCLQHTPWCCSCKCCGAKLDSEVLPNEYVR